MKFDVKNMDMKKLIYVIAAAVSLVALPFNPSISFGLVLGFVFCTLNLKLVYKTMDDAFSSNNPMKLFSKTSVFRFALLAGFIYLAVWFAPYFHLLGITIGMVLAMIESIYERKKVQ